MYPASDIRKNFVHARTLKYQLPSRFQDAHPFRNNILRFPLVEVFDDVYGYCNVRLSVRQCKFFQVTLNVGVAIKINIYPSVPVMTARPKVEFNCAFRIAVFHADASVLGDSEFLI